jgi:peroxiredoxin
VKKRYLIAIVIAGIILIMMSAIHFFETPSKGDVALPFTLKDTAGNEISLESERGKVVLLHFWAPWCEVCMAEVPVIEKLYDDFKGRDLALLTVLVDDDGRHIPAIKKRTPIDYPVLIDPEGEVADSYRVWGVPESLIIGRDGVILDRWATATDYAKAKAQLEHYLSR